MQRIRRIARWGEIGLSRLPRRWQARLGGISRALPGVQKSMVFSPLYPASQLIVLTETCVDPLLPYPTSLGRPVLSQLQAYDLSGKLRCRIKRSFVQVGPYVRPTSGIRRVAQKEVAGAVVYCGGPSQRNWHHWLLEILPSAFHAAREAQVSILVPDEVRASPTHLDSLHRLFTERKVHFIRAGEIVLADEIRISSWWLSWKIPGSRDQRALNRLFAREYVASLAWGLKSVNGNGPRVFLMRGPVSRRSYNETECLEAAAEYGFVPVNTGTMSFAEQVATVSEAEVVVGPSGAAMANLLFARPGTRAIVIGRQTGSTHWDRIADIQSFEVHGLPWAGLTDGSGHRQANLTELQKAIRDQI